MSEELKAAQARIACLEGEIAKRDETIARLEPQLNRAIQANYDLREELAACRVAVENCELFRAELAAIKAQEPVAYISGCYRDVIDGKSDRTPLGAELAFVNMGWIGQIPLYAAPVSEAKAQGVVQWPDADEIMQMAFEEGQPADDASGYCFELEEFDLFIERLMSEVARLNAASVQQVSVPDGWRELAKRADDFLYSLPETDGVLRLRADLCTMLSAPAAPAADAGLVEALEHARLFIVNGIDLGFIQMPEAGTPDPAHETLPMIDAALSAHRAQGVV